MPVMTIGTNSLEEKMAAMKAMLELLVKESEEKEAHIKLQEEKIARLTRNLEKRPAQSLAKSLESEEEDRAFVQSEVSNKEVHSKKGGKVKSGRSPSLMTIEQIQDLIANAVKIKLCGGARMTHLYTKSIDVLYMPRGYQSPKFQQFDGKSNLWGVTKLARTTT